MPPNDVAFDEQKGPAPVSSGGISGFMVKKGLASSEAAANLTLLILAGISVVIALVVIFKFSSAPHETGLQSPPPSEYGAGKGAQ